MSDAKGDEPREKWDWRMDRLAFFDLESTGIFAPGNAPPLLLEAALIVTTADLVELGRESVVVRQPRRLLDAHLHPVAREMHETSGLLEEVLGSDALDLGEAELVLVRLMHALTGESHAPVIWGGCSPAAVDRPLVKEHMPDLYRRIHHRTLDSSCLKLALVNWAGVDPKRYKRYEARHRAMSDCEDAVKLARTCKVFMRRTRWLERRVEMLESEVARKNLEIEELRSVVAA